MQYNITDILISILMTVVVYASFPIIFAKLRKNKISKTRYRVYSFVVNFILHCVLSGIGVFGSFTNAAPMVVWTLVFTSFGYSMMEDKEAATTEAAEDTTEN